MRHEQFITLSTAELAKQAGFNWKVYTRYFRGEFREEDDCMNYNNLDWFGRLSYSAPVQSVLQKWLREVKGMSVEIYHMIVLAGGDTPKIEWCYRICYLISNESDILSSIEFNTYEEALEAAEQKCLTSIIEKQ